jgi:hypothetical protein
MRIFYHSIMVSLFVTAAVSAEDRFVPLPYGETNLADAGNFRVTWQSYGQRSVVMPPEWTGADPQSGIIYDNRAGDLGRRVMFVHCPHRVAPGTTWVDYPLSLLAARPIRLSFGIAISPGAAGKGDGVTFSCGVSDAGRRESLMREHYTKAEWKDYQFDLSACAGKKVVLRFQVEPGSKNDATWDWSFFGDVKVRVGEPGQRDPGLVRRLTATRAYLATAQVGLRSLWNRTDQGIIPSNILPYANVCEKSSSGYRLTYKADDCRVVYTYKPVTGTLEDFTFQVDNSPALQMARGADIVAIVKQGDQSREIALRGGRMVKSSADKDSFGVRWDYPVDGQMVQIRWNFKIVGKALAVQAACDNPIISRFSLGEVGMAPLRRRMTIPYLLSQNASVEYLPVENVFAHRYLDWTVSHASGCQENVAHYHVKNDGKRNPLVEAAYIAVSPCLDEVLPNLPFKPSPYLAVLGPRIMLDIWEHHHGSYKGDAENLAALNDDGVDHLAIIQHVWQHAGYDAQLPDTLPANSAFGSDAELAAFGQTARRFEMPWALHENYIDVYPDAPSYDASARVLSSDGTPSKAWYNPATKVQSYGLKCNRAMEFAKKFAPEIHHRYATTASYLDVHTAVPPWHEVDCDAAQPMAGMTLAKVTYDSMLFQFMRETHEGPLFGEGYWHFFWAGKCDGVEAQVEGGEDHAPLLNFDLLKIHPQMVNHGMGYYERWFRQSWPKWGHDAGTVEQIDKYRAQELAYGHAGFIGKDQIDNIPWVVREHHLVHAVQRLYGTAQPEAIHYEVDGQLVGDSVAAVAGDTTRQRIRYDNGLTLWVNWRAEPWQVEGRTLPQWGFLALGPETQVWTALRDGHWADYAECPEYVFVDARTRFPMSYRQGQNAPPKDKTEPDFTARMNPPGTWIDFGSVATDGSVKINCKADRLVLFPYPRDRSFRVQINLKALAPKANLSTLNIRVLSAGKCQDLGPATFKIDGRRVTLTTGTPRAGRYVITW